MRLTNLHRLPAGLAGGVSLVLSACASNVAVGAERPVEVVHSASAAYSATQPHTIVVDATVDLPNSCWSNPRFQTPAPGAVPDANGTIDVTILADYSGGPGMACGMIFRPAVKVPELLWSTYPKAGLRAVNVVGSTTSVVAPVSGAQSERS